MTRLNKYVAGATELSRRAADGAIAAGRVSVNGQVATLGIQVEPQDKVMLDGNLLSPPRHQYVLFNKPTGYVCSRRQQGNTPTIYSLLPIPLRRLNSVGRLDKDSSGLLLLTDDGDFAEKLTHPSQQKDKRYQVELDRTLASNDKTKLEQGVELEDGFSRMQLSGSAIKWEVVIHEGRNRQIRRSFAALGYTVIKLHRTQFGPYSLNDLKTGEFQNFEPQS